MNIGGLLAANGPLLVAALGLGWAIIRYEVERYARLHPHSAIVQDAERIVAEGRALAAGMGLTPDAMAHWVAGYVSGKGLHVTAAQLLAGAAAVQNAAQADQAAVAGQK